MNSHTAGEKMNEEEIFLPLQRLYAEVINEGRLEIMEELYSADYINNIAPFGLSKGVDGLYVLFGAFKDAFPDQHIVADSMVRSGNLVIARWTISGTHSGTPFFGVPASGRRFEMTGVDIERIERGRIVEHWGAEDMLALLVDIGAIAAPNLSFEAASSSWK